MSARSADLQASLKGGGGGFLRNRETATRVLKVETTRFSWKKLAFFPLFFFLEGSVCVCVCVVQLPRQAEGRGRRQQRRRHPEVPPVVHDGGGGAAGAGAEPGRAVEGGPDPARDAGDADAAVRVVGPGDLPEAALRPAGGLQVAGVHPVAVDAGDGPVPPGEGRQQGQQGQQGQQAGRRQGLVDA